MVSIEIDLIESNKSKWNKVVPKVALNEHDNEILERENWNERIAKRLNLPDAKCVCVCAIVSEKKARDWEIER